MEKKITKEQAAEMAKKAVAAKKKAEAAKSATKEKSAPKKEAPKRERAEKDEPEQGEEKAKPTRQDKGGKGQVKGLRIGAIILWVLAIAAEVGAFFALRYVIANKAVFPDQEMLLLIGALVIDAICCIVAAQLWKKSNRIRPCLADSKLVRTLWHQLGVIMVLICFIPLGIYLLLKSKELEKKTRTILLVVFALLFAGATATSVDYQQPSEEEVQQLQAEAAAELGDDATVYWTRYGKSYHFDSDCQSLRNTSEANLFSGPLDSDDPEVLSAFGANRWDPCDFCAYGGEVDAEPAG